jgi:phosphopantetheinyl transferase
MQAQLRFLRLCEIDCRTVICFQHTIGPVHLLALDKTGSELDLTLFNNRDFAFMNETFSAQLRRNEWLWGRAALKLLLQKACGTDPIAVFVGRDAQERPLLQEPLNLAQTKISVSVSHKPPFYFAGICVGQSIGIDIETRDDQTAPRSFGRFISDDERAAYNPQCGVSEQDYLILLWCVKEAYLKASGGTSIVALKDSRFALTLRDDAQGYDAHLLQALPKAPLLARAFATQDFCAAVVTCEMP